MRIVTTIDEKLYSEISGALTSILVIITDERIRHIQRRHPGDWERYGTFAAGTLTDPDFILRDDHPDTAICVKRVEADGEWKCLRATLRLKTSAEPEGWENSLLTFQKINLKEYRRLSRTALKE